MFKRLREKRIKKITNDLNTMLYEISKHPNKEFSMYDKFELLYGWLIYNGHNLKLIDEVLMNHFQSVYNISREALHNSIKDTKEKVEGNEY